MKLLDICEAIVDCPHSTSKDEGNGYPLIRTPNVGKGRLKLAGVHRVSENVYNLRNERAVPQVDDLILAREAPVGNVAIIRQGQRVCLGQRTVLIRPNKKCVDPDFLVYYLLSPELQHKLLSSANGATVSHLNMSSIRSLEVQVPDIEVQKRIGAILARIDDKIELNNAINENLEQQAYLLLEQMLSIPHDDVCCLSDIANINPRYTLSKGTEARYIDMSQLSTTTSFPDGWTFRPYNGGMKFKNKDTIMARITPCLENGKTAYIDFLDGEEIAFGSTEYIVLSPKDNIPPELLYCIVRYPEFRTYATINMNGSSGRQRVSGEIIGKYEIPSFTKEELSEFGAVAEPLFKQITENSLQNRNLSALRDTLLPKLMNGEIDVSEVKI